MKTILIAAVVSLLASILCTPLVVAYFRRRGFGQEIRSDGPQSHLVKRGTPTMGGVAIIGSTVLGYAFAHVIIVIRGGGGVQALGSTTPQMRSAARAGPRRMRRLATRFIRQGRARREQNRVDDSA